ncbi:MAG: ATP-dependent DNA helicase RecG [Candidatus Komeilibacteria bacterium]
MLTLETKVESVNRVGKTIATRLKKIGINTVADMLWHLPVRYDDFSQIKPIADLNIDELTTVRARIELLANRRARHRKLTITEALVNDDSGSLKVVWFNQPYITKTFKIGDDILLAGKVAGDLLGRQMNNPSYEKAQEQTTHTGRLVPIYSSTEKLTQKQLRFIVKSCLPAITQIKDWLPADIRQKYHLLNLREALMQIHFPDDNDNMLDARRRLQFNQIFLLQLQNQLIKNQLAEQTAPAIEFKQKEIKEFVDSLPFQLTPDQKRAGWEIIKDMNSGQPMNRLLNGDVGSGKTVVAALAAYDAIINGYQVALMAPTAILAEQHWQTICKLWPSVPWQYGLITQNQRLIAGQTKAKNISKVAISKALSKGEINFIIGTHALIQKNINFANLGLVIVDEQHRFGVKQRQQLQEQSGDPDTMPHFLSLTATPIPRTLALAIYGNLNISLLKTKPAGRKPIITKLVTDQQRRVTYEFINKQLDAGHQVFVVCPLIDESDKLGVKSVTAEYKHLNEEIFPHRSVALLHGKLKAEDKAKVMADFQANKINILVATSVIEVGVDVPNATIMMIEGADRFGLAQLHQFRGRVGRGDNQAYCFLLSNNNSPRTLERLQTLVRTNDGFALAEADLKQRGAGEFYGDTQSGFMNNLLYQAITNITLVKEAQNAVQDILNDDKKLKKHPLIAKKINQIQNTIHLE